MSTLIACLSTGKGTWGHVSRLIKENPWDNILLVTNEFGKENFTKDDKTDLIIINTSQGIQELAKEIHEKLKDKIKDPEIALNIVSGTGKEHTALLSAVLKLGVGIRFVALTQEGMKEV
ncbi:MAG: hypothetical protein CMH63_00585 [Nanoarchaeota archaeon]|jgi:hypothetical protein|nr:hypothetical protein [Nanoarchaeota archaeon]|tara:strand:+ start:1823 stop:2179 length:357 start_codon:yes stop_codon:yes gene_type:complete